MRTRTIIDNYYVRKLYGFLSSRRIIILSVLLLVSITLTLIITPNTASAENNIKTKKSVTVYQIKAGDTIWSIAEEYYTPECGKFTDYIREIKKSNGLLLDTIYSDCYLIIPYYIAQ